MFSIDSKVVVITGAAGILCSEMARGMASLGAKIALLDLNAERAGEIAEQIAGAGGEVFAVGCDILDKESVLAARKAVMARYGRVDVLVNGAGGNRPDATTGAERNLFDMPLDAFRRVFDLNVTGAVLTLQVFGEVMRDQGTGSVINICSMSGIRPLTNVVAYSAAKAALANFTQWSAAYFNLNVSKQIRVNAIAPGFLLTEQNRFLLTDKETGEATERGAHIIKQTPMGRYGDPKELVGAVVFLASDEASFINGVVLPIDGGFSAYAI